MRREGQQNIHHFFSSLHALGIRHIVVSPGSRNAPLLQAAVAHAGFDVLTVVDERSAAYKALGMAQITQLPVVLICTSGTALLNYFPAIAEAKHSGIPLIVLSADRPSSLLNSWENQSINQQKVFGNYVNKFFAWKGLFERNRCLGKVERLAMKVFAALQFPDPGPVHLNFELSEPLYFPDELGFKPTFSLKKSIKSYTPKSFEEKLTATAKQILVVCGSGPYSENIFQDLKTLKNAGAVILCDLLSPYRSLNSEPTWEAAVASLSEETWLSLKPDTLVTTGRYLLNKKLKTLLKKFPPNQHLHLADTNLKYDPYQSKPKWSHSINGSLTLHSASDNTYLLSWETLFKKHLNHIETALNEETIWSELTAIRSFLALLPAQSVLHIANSMSIRYVAFWGVSTAVNCMSNRGTSGIDGCLSTAVGAALATPNLKHFVLIGDLAFFYDSNALWTPEIPPNLHIVLLNNKGGMIFNMIPGPTQSVAHKQITSPHNLNAEFICKGYGLTYSLVKNQTEWTEVLPKFMSHSKANLLEIQTLTDNNIRIWNKLKM